MFHSIAYSILSCLHYPCVVKASQKTCGDSRSLTSGYENLTRYKLTCRQMKAMELNFPPSRHPRRCGILLHPTSFPGPYLTGDLGPEAYAFIDWLESSKMQVWQVLPLVPPGRPIPGIR